MAAFPSSRFFAVRVQPVRSPAHEFVLDMLMRLKSVVALLCLFLAHLAFAGPTAGQTDGAVLYEKACAACHGSDGRGRTVEDLGFELELPDFTDCEFTSREPDPDWHAVIHEGGPVRAFDRMMPAFGDALMDEEIYAILQHIRTFCSNKSWPRGEFNVPKSLYTEKAFPEDEIYFSLKADTDDSKAVMIETVYENRFGPRGMTEVKVPVGRRNSPQDNSANVGFGDLTLGLRYAIYHNLERGHALSVGGEVILPTGKEEDGFGTGSTRLEPHVAFVQLLPGDAFFQAQALGYYAVSGPAQDKVAVRTAIGRTFTAGEFGRAWSPMVELLASRELVSGTDATLDVVPQIQVSLNTRQHILFNIGVRIPVANKQDRKAQIAMYLLWDWFDGGFLDGW